MRNLALGLAALTLSSAAYADYPLKGDETILCTGMQYYECLLHKGCSQVAPADISAPTLFTIDLADGRIDSRSGPDDSRSTEVKQRVVIDNKIILQGAEDGVEGVRDGLGWTAAITLDEGIMSLTASTDGAAFVIMGACRPVPR
jgi:hypothetical protein